MLGLLILITIGIFIGIKLYYDSLREKKKQTELMGETLQVFQSLCKLQGDANMKLNLDEILAGHGATANPTQATAISKDISVGLRNMSSIGAAMAGNFARVAVNTGIQNQTKDLNDLNNQVAEFAEILAGKTAQDGEQAAVAALGQQQQQAIAEPATSSEESAPEQQVPAKGNSHVEEASGAKMAEELPPPPAEVYVDMGSPQPVAEVVNTITASEEEVPFTLNDLRQLIRDADCLKHAYHISNPGQSIAGDFEIRERDARALVNTLLAKEKQGKLAEMKLGQRALKFLRDEYTPVAWLHGSNIPRVKSGAFFCIFFKYMIKSYIYILKNKNE